MGIKPTQPPTWTGAGAELGNIPTGASTNPKKLFLKMNSNII